jgi:hypothetical protein
VHVVSSALFIGYRCSSWFSTAFQGIAERCCIYPMYVRCCVAVHVCIQLLSYTFSTCRRHERCVSVASMQHVLWRLQSPSAGSCKHAACWVSGYVCLLFPAVLCAQQCRTCSIVCSSNPSQCGCFGQLAALRCCPAAMYAEGILSCAAAVAAGYVSWYSTLSLFCLPLFCLHTTAACQAAVHVVRLLACLLLTVHGTDSTPCLRPQDDSIW